MQAQMVEQTVELKDHAERLFGAKKFRRSLQLYLELIARQPRDPRLRVRAGELRRRLDDSEDAARDYLKAAELFARQGHGAKARAALKIACELDACDEVLSHANRLVGMVSATPSTTTSTSEERAPRRNVIELGAESSWERRTAAIELEEEPAVSEATVPEPQLTGWFDLEPEREEPRANTLRAPVDDLCPEDEFEKLHH